MRRKREEEGAGDVLIKGNSEGLDQIILHNLVREDTAFDTEKMEMTCPRRPVPTVEDQSVVAKAVHSDHGEVGVMMMMMMSVFIHRTAPATQLSGDTARLNPRGRRETRRCCDPVGGRIKEFCRLF